MLLVHAMDFHKLSKVHFHSTFAFSTVGEIPTEVHKKVRIHFTDRCHRSSLPFHSSCKQLQPGTEGRRADQCPLCPSCAWPFSVLVCPFGRSLATVTVCGSRRVLAFTTRGRSLRFSRGGQLVDQPLLPLVFGYLLCPVRNVCYRQLESRHCRLHFGQMSYKKRKEIVSHHFPPPSRPPTRTKLSSSKCTTTKNVH